MYFFNPYKLAGTRMV